MTVEPTSRTPIEMQSGEWTIRARPERGGRITSLRLRGVELLDQGIGVDNPRAAGFVEGGAWGWDEMVPTLDAAGDLPDHGEAWRLQWQVLRSAPVELSMRCRGRLVPWELTRTIHLRQGKVVAAYTYRNAGQLPHRAYWCAHPLFRFEPAMVIGVPGGEWLAAIPEGSSAKRFLPRGIAKATLSWPDGSAVEMSWDPALTPHVGVWVCNGDLGGYRQSASSLRLGRETGQTLPSRLRFLLPAGAFGGACRSPLSKLSLVSKLLGLRCRECGAEYELQATHVCEMCFGPLDVVYDSAALKKVVSRHSIEQGPKSMWRYRDLLPIDDTTPVVTLGEGMTPLIKADRLGAELGLRNLYLKNDSMNPTNSFKDRVVSVAISWARAHGFETIACASTGNLANAVAAYAARAGLECFVFIPVDLEPAKLASIGVFEPNVVAVRGTYDDVNRLCSQLVDSTPWAFCNINIRPFYAEGSKTLTFETAEQLGWKLPDELIIPIASGCQFVRHRQAVGELIEYGLVRSERIPAFTGAQALGCAPVYRAFASDDPERVLPVKPDTIARSIAIGNPSDGVYVNRIARASGGTIEAVTEVEIVDAMRLLARTEGVFTETAGGVTIGVLAKLARSGRWRGDELIVAYVTGHGLKTADVLTSANGHARRVEIEPTLKSFRSLVDI